MQCKTGFLPSVRAQAQSVMAEGGDQRGFEYKDENDGPERTFYRYKRQHGLADQMQFEGIF